MQGDGWPMPLKIVKSPKALCKITYRKGEGGVSLAIANFLLPDPVFLR